MSGTPLVTRLRISHVAGKIHDTLREIDGPDEFENWLIEPRPVRGLPVTLPFGPGLKVDQAFWSKNIDDRLTVPISNARRLRRAAVPLRYSGRLDTAADNPRLEAHIHPFGVVALTTVDLIWAKPVDLVRASAQVRALEGQRATITVHDVQHATTLGQASKKAADVLVARLSNHNVGTAWDTSGHRLITIISGRLGGRLASMPPADGPLHLAMHDLSAGNNTLSEPADAFVAQWSGTGYTWPPTSLVYMRDDGTATLCEEAHGGKPGGGVHREEPTADRHRRLLLTLSYITALYGLVHAQATGEASSPYFGEWANAAAARLGRLFGPAATYKEWGLVPQALLERLGANEDVTRVSGSPLMPSKTFRVASYPL